MQTENKNFGDDDTMSNNKFTFVPAHATDSYLRMGLMGVSGSGKTWSALAIATGVADGGKIAVIDTEHGSASKYRRQFQFDVLNLEDHDPRAYVEAINAAKDAGYKVLIIDSLSHAWAGRGGVLEIADNETARSKSRNSYMAWKNVTPLQNQLIDTLIRTPIHIIATMRTKSEYVVEKDERTGKTAPRKVGMAPIQGKDLEYEFDVTGEMNAEHQMVITKSRCPEITDAVIQNPTSDVGVILKKWLREEGEGIAPPMPGEPHEPAPQTIELATPADVSKYEAIRQAAVDFGYRINGNEPSHATTNVPRDRVLKGISVMQKWLDGITPEAEEEESTQTPPSPTMCDKEKYQKKYFAIAKDTKYAGAQDRADFIRAFTNGKTGSLSTALETMTVIDAQRLCKTLQDRITAEAGEFDDSDPFAEDENGALPLETATAGTNTAHQ